MTVSRIKEEINWPQLFLTLLPIVLMAIGAWTALSNRMAVLEDRVGSHLASPGHVVTMERVGAMERQIAVSDKGAEEILRRLDEINQRLVRMEQRAR